MCKLVTLFNQISMFNTHENKEKTQELYIHGNKYQCWNKHKFDDFHKKNDKMYCAKRIHIFVKETLVKLEFYHCKFICEKHTNNWE